MAHHGGVDGVWGGAEAEDIDVRKQVAGRWVRANG